MSNISPDPRGCLYRLIFPNGKAYIGITMRSLAIRIAKHIAAAKSGKDWLVARAIRAHSLNFTSSMLAVGRMSYLQDLEIAAIQAFRTRSPSGYNLTAGGQTSPSREPEVRAKISAAMAGRKLSLAHIAHISDAMRLNSPSRRPEVAAKISAANRGRQLSAEHRAKLSAAQLALGDRHHSKRPEWRAKAAETAKKIAARPDVRAKQSKRMMGNANPSKRLEVRAKLSLAWGKRRAR